MLRICLLNSFWILGIIVYGQAKNDRLDGFYISVNQFVKNQPSKTGFHIYEKSKPPTSSFGAFVLKEGCFIGVATDEPVGEIWGFTLDGKSYINHNGCYYRIVQHGQLCTYYYLESSIVQYKRPTEDFHAHKTPKVQEKVLVASTGEILDKRANVRRIIEIIKSDPDFRDKRISKKKIDTHISEYNDRHSLTQLARSLKN
ncbi:MAG: hypothetical protein AAF731_16085 [Bacteroidota bacterium]